MTTRDWVLLGWIWVAGLTLLGIGLLLAPRINAATATEFQRGQGTALLLIAASILFAAVFPTLGTNANQLVSSASVLTAMFGYAGTLIILPGENPILLAIVIVFTLYLAVMAFALVGIVRLIRIIFARL
ncbi:MAG: hypothetical protein J4G13_00810 [Dehalococcoidia bacterium]|nr:hypothetical protein [Dehalococcoidia bacterium]